MTRSRETVEILCISTIDQVDDMPGGRVRRRSQVPYRCCGSRRPQLADRMGFAVPGIARMCDLIPSGDVAVTKSYGRCPEPTK